MIDWLIAKWRSYQFKLALKQGKFKEAQSQIQKINKLNKKLSWLEKLYQQQLDAEKSLSFYQREVSFLRQKLQIYSQENTLQSNLNFLDNIYDCFQMKESSCGLWQCTGIETEVFTDLEKALVDFLETEINKISEEIRGQELQKAIADLDGLKKGIDPLYNHRLSSHVYLLKYFLDNIYSAYLGWFFIYQKQLLPKQIKILDLAAGPGTVVYGLALLLSSMQKFFPIEKVHITYYSLEQQAELQYRGLQFWRKYIELATPINAYFRFNTIDLFDYNNYAHKLPVRFFDFIAISHCFFYDLQSRQDSYQIYRQIFERCLANDGYVLLIIQGQKLLKMYDTLGFNSLEGEAKVVRKFLEELGLQLEWYQYLSATGQRKINKQDFARFARDNLPPQTYLTSLKQMYLGQPYPSNYAIDDYIILAKKS